MRSLILGLVFVTCAVVPSFAAGQVNNSATGLPEDSISFSFINGDSAMLPLAGLDTTRIYVYYPGGTQAFTETIEGVTGRVSTTSVPGYIYTAKVSDIDGSGPDGVYNIDIVAVSNESGGWLTTVTSGQFQIVGQRISTFYANVIDSLNQNLQDLRDSIWTAADRSLTALDEDNTTIDLNGTEIGSVSSDVSITDADMGNVADSSLAVLLAMSSSDTLTNTYLAELLNNTEYSRYQIDSLKWLTGVVDSARSIIDTAETQDTLWLLIGLDTLGYRVYMHQSGTRNPDSTIFKVWP